MKPDLLQLLTADGGSLRAADTASAYAWCATLARGHYENFPVGSVLLPRAIRRHLMAIYAFARTADDVADEPWTSSRQSRLQGLNFMGRIAREASEGRVAAGHPILVALSQSMHDRRLPLAPFLDLIEAFRRDVSFVQPATWGDVFDYCRYSAQPVGRLVLITSDVHDEQAHAASDAICTALQLVNFWQDLSVDVARGRTYIPAEAIQRIGKSNALSEAFEHTAEFFQRGREIARFIPFARLRWELNFVVNCGERMLQKCRDLGERCWYERPSLQRSEYLSLAVRSFVGVRTSRSSVR